MEPVTSPKSRQPASGAATAATATTKAARKRAGREDKRGIWGPGRTERDEGPTRTLREAASAPLTRVKPTPEAGSEAIARY